MTIVSKELYDRLMENRPFKLSASEVNYGESDSDNRCDNCVHFYTRVVDDFHTCEIFRPSDDETVEPSYVCDYWNDGTNSEPTSSS